MVAHEVFFLNLFAPCLFSQSTSFFFGNWIMTLAASKETFVLNSVLNNRANS